MTEQHEMTKFDFKGRLVRIVKVDGNEWWIAKDVCESLEIKDASQAVQGLDDDEHRKITVSEPDPGNVGSGVIPRTYVVVSEAGLYKLILRSHKLEAREFTRWLTHEVLPKIRRTGFWVAEGDEGRVRDVLDRILRHKAMNWDMMWRQEVSKSLAPLYGQSVDPTRFPVWMCGLINRIYTLLFGEETMDEARRRRGPHTGKGNLLQQWFTDESRQYLRDNIHVVLALAQTSSSSDDFWSKLRAVFGKSMLQLPLFLEQGTCPKCGFYGGEGLSFCGKCGTAIPEV